LDQNLGPAHDASQRAGQNVLHSSLGKNRV
jgi:hypothetical protein